jgi:hypothetical protein
MTELIYKKQVEAVEGALPSRLRDVIAAIAAAALTSLALGSNALLNWTNNLPIGPVSDFLLNMTQTWQNWMTAIGLTKFSSACNSALTALQSWH